MALLSLALDWWLGGMRKASLFTLCFFHCWRRLYFGLHLIFCRFQPLKGFVFEEIGQNFSEFYSNHLPFELTGAQKRVIKEIRADLGSGAQMNRLLQGDVGSGKTIVALMSMFIALDNGFQACLMAPTEIGKW